MKVIAASAMGLCFGVRDALQVTRNLAAPTQITIFGQLVHNPLITDELAARGFPRASESSRNSAAITTPAVLITAHGISNRQRAALLAQNKRLIDTTCPLVRRAHEAALQLAREGAFVIIIGKPTHVEVRGLAGDLDPDRHDIIESPAAARPYPHITDLGIIAQTTTPDREARAIVTRITELNPHARIRFINTICQPTKDRQSALERLLQQVDILVVVGGKNSNNTRQLAARAQETGIPAIHVEDASSLSPKMFTGHETIGLTAGTSTLPATIEAVRRTLEQFHSTDPIASKVPPMPSSAVDNQPTIEPLTKVIP